MALWSVLAAPLIMGNDLRNISAASKAILLNKGAIKVDQDPLGKMGLRVNKTSQAQVWARELDGGDVAVALYNSEGGAPAGIDLVATGAFCNNKIGAGNGSSFGYTLASCRDAVVANPKCKPGQGFFYYSQSYNGQCDCAIDDCTKRTQNAVYDIYKLNPGAPATGSNITVDFKDVGILSSDPVDVYDIWAGKVVGSFVNAYTAEDVQLHGTAFLRISKKTTVRTPEDTVSVLV